jgi:hypothetical protein
MLSRALCDHTSCCAPTISPDPQKIAHQHCASHEKNDRQEPREVNGFIRSRLLKILPPIEIIRRLISLPLHSADALFQAATFFARVHVGVPLQVVPPTVPTDKDAPRRIVRTVTVSQRRPRLGVFDQPELHRSVLAFALVGDEAGGGEACPTRFFRPNVLVSLAPEGGGGGRAGSFVELEDNHEDRKKNQ